MLRPLLILLLLGATAFVAWQLLRGVADDEEQGIEVRVEAPGPRSVPAAVPSAGPAPLRHEGVPGRPEVRVAVLGPGEPLPSEAACAANTRDVWLYGSRGPVTGADVVRALGEGMHLRVASAADLQALKALEPPPDWSDADHHLRAEEILEHWQAAGFHVEDFVHVAVVHRRPEADGR